ncbi:B12-binding domain-containing radical SAM protein [Thermodesulfobacteriota bacterium]
MNKKITLIAPPWYSVGNIPYLSANLGLGYIASYLETYGHKVQIIDALAEGLDNSFEVWSYGRKIVQTGLSYEEIVQRIDPDTEIIGITCPFTMFAQIVKDLAHIIKRSFPHINIVLGGVYPSTMPEHALTEDVDYVVQGEGEIPLLQLLDGIDPHHIKGLVFRGKNHIINNGSSQEIADLDQIPFPARHLLPMDKYLLFSSRGTTNQRTVNIITSRGCPFNCDFCSVHPIFGHNWRFRSPGNVLEEIRLLITDYDITHIEFEDDNLTLNKDRARIIFHGLAMLSKDLKKDITWAANNGVRVDRLDRDLLVKMKNSGCVGLGLGVESGDPVTLNKMNKKIDSLDKVLEIAEICKELKLPTTAFMIVGHPAETEEGFYRSLDFFMKLKILGVSNFPVHIIKAYPGTNLYEDCREKGYLVHSELTHTRNIEGWPRLNRRNTDIVTEHFTAKDILNRRDFAHKKLNPIGFYSEKYPGIFSLYRKIKPLIPEKLRKKILYLVRR